MVSFLFTILQLGYTRKFRWSIIMFVKSQCLNFNSLSCFGGHYRRNVFTLNEIFGHIMSLLMFQLLYNVMIVYFQLFCGGENSHIHFIIHNIFYVCFVDLYILVIVPVKQLILCNDIFWNPELRNENMTKPFYVRNPMDDLQLNTRNPLQHKTRKCVLIQRQSSKSLLTNPLRNPMAECSHTSKKIHPQHQIRNPILNERQQSTSTSMPPVEI